MTLHAQTRDILELIQRALQDARVDAGEAYAAEPSVLRVVSPLAEGADRIVAAEGLDLGCELQCPLPFGRDAYEEDFGTPESWAEYRGFLARATTVLELDGARDTESRRDQSYLAVGQMVLKHCDLLIALWDGVQARGVGGTAQIVQQALQLRLPVIWVHASPPHTARLLLHDASGRRVEHGLEKVGEQVHQTCRPPDAADPAREHEATRDLREAYFAERQRRHNALGWAWGLFFAAIADLGRRRRGSALYSVGSSSALPSPNTDAAGDLIGRHFAWADALSVFYAGRHRGSFVISYGLGILAVFCELVADLVFRTEAHQLARLLLRLAAVLAVSSILTVWLWASSQHWNERRIDYRFLAELFRQLRFLRLVGRPAKMLLLPPHTAYASAETSWIGWYLRAVAHEAGMVGASFTAEYLEAVRILLREDLVKGQIGFHAEAAARLARAERVLRWCGFATFAAAWSLLVFLILRENAWIATFAAAAPVLGAALAAIRGQAELERLAKRSQAMCAQLSRVADQLTQQQATLTSAALGDVAESLAELMTSEVLDWRVVFLGRLMELTS